MLKRCLALLAMVGCAPVVPAPTPGPAVATTRPVPMPRPARPRGFASLAVPGFLPAVVWTPAPRDRRYPLLVATHGAGGVPEADCDDWMRRVGDRAFVLCPRGKGIVASGAEGYYYPNHHDLDHEVIAAVDALRADAGALVDTDRVVYAGYSQGATMGALMVRAHAALFPRLALVEGGFAEWTLLVARAYRKDGGQRVLFVCGTAGCNSKARRSAQWLKQAGIDVTLDYAPGAGHTSAGAVAERVDAHVAWLLSGDPRW